MKNNTTSHYANLGSLKEISREKEKLEKRIKGQERVIISEVEQVCQAWSFIPKTARFISQITENLPQYLQIATFVIDIFLRRRRKTR